MKYKLLSEEAKMKAIETAYGKVQEDMIDWEYEMERMKGTTINNYLSEYHCNNGELNWSYEFSKVFLSSEKLEFDLLLMLKQQEHLLDIWKQILDISGEYSEICVSISPRNIAVSFTEDYEWEDLEKKLKYMEKYAAEYGVNVDKYIVPVMFGAKVEEFEELQAEFEKIYKGNGQKIAEYVLKQAEEMLGKIKKGIEDQMEHLESEEYVKWVLENNEHSFDFYESGEML
ncbi:hypothetical protein [Bacillus toyonensis]|uniref:hypothetical protein n=1 Tax=Bacillus toyonensis TaxID=155322 RepID=UPI002E246AFB|nr:hypothetical protein [Bacillus toyonensis]